MLELFTSIFNLLTETKVYDVPLMVWLVIPLLLLLVVSFLKGSKDEK